MATVAKNDEISVEKSDIDAFFKLREECKADIDEARGDIGAAHKKLIDDKGCNKKGLAMIAQLAAMKPQKRADALRTFDKIRAFYANEWAQGDLVDQAEEKTAENVVPLKSAAQAASEIMDEAI